MCQTRSLHTYPVLYEKEGDFVAHLKFTAFVMPNGSSQVTQGPRSILDLCKSEVNWRMNLDKVLKDMEALALAKAERKE